MAMSDENRLSSRVRRYAQVSSKMGGLAARMAGQRYLGIQMDRDRHAVELKEALGGLKGPLMKVAQIMSTIPDALPKEYAEELSQLQANAPHMGWPFVRRRMATELGADWQSRFKSFEREAKHAASLGQVHQAVLHDDRTVACKLQYPDMGSVVAADLRQLNLIFSIYRRYDRAIDPSNIHAELSERLNEELDYAREARHMALYREMLDKEPGVFVPDVVPDLSTTRLLTMTWLYGARILTYQDRDLEDRNQVAKNMFRAWYVPFYEYAVIHGDPHLGNYTVRDDCSINLLDFGCIRVFPPHFVTAVIDLYRATQRKDRDLAAHAYRTWGFENLTDEIIDVLNIWAEFVYAPLMEDRARLIEETNSGVYGREVAEKVHIALKEVGGVRPPREFLLMDRAALGLGSVFLRLRACVNWHQLFEEAIAGFDEAVLAERQKDALTRHNLPVPAT